MGIEGQNPNTDDKKESTRRDFLRGAASMAGAGIIGGIVGAQIQKNASPEDDAFTDEYRKLRDGLEWDKERDEKHGGPESPGSSAEHKHPSKEELNHSLEEVASIMEEIAKMRDFWEPLFAVVHDQLRYDHEAARKDELQNLRAKIAGILDMLEQSERNIENVATSKDPALVPGLVDKLKDTLNRAKDLETSAREHPLFNEILFKALGHRDA